jgi:hypothetical protein
VEGVAKIEESHQSCLTVSGTLPWPAGENLRPARKFSCLRFGMTSMRTASFNTGTRFHLQTIAHKASHDSYN